MGQHFFLQIFLHIFSRGSFEITRIMQKSIVLHSKCHFIGSLFSSDFSSFFLVFCKKISWIFYKFSTSSRICKIIHSIFYRKLEKSSRKHWKIALHYKIPLLVKDSTISSLIGYKLNYALSVSTLLVASCHSYILELPCTPIAAVLLSM